MKQIGYLCKVKTQDKFQMKPNNIKEIGFDQIP